MAVAVTLPRAGQSVESCILTVWHKKKGEKVHEGEILFSYETDKAAFDEEAKTGGILLDTFFSEGEEVPVLTTIAVIGDAGEDITGFRPGAETEKSSPGSKTAGPSPERISEFTSETSGRQSAGRTGVSPRARILAGHHHLDVALINGTGPNGRIIVRDIENFLEKKEKPSLQKKIADVSGDFNLMPLSNIRRIIAENMLNSLRNSAQLTHHLSADARKILAVRKRFKEEAKAVSKDISLNDMLCFAVVKSLENHPEMNAHFLGDKIKTFRSVHLGIAVDTPRGLMVPVLRNASSLNLQELSSGLKKIAADCRNNSIDPALLPGEAGSFTVSNLGVYGIEMFTPVLNLPQVGILGVNTISWQPRETEESVISFVPVIGLSLTYDHRAVDGAPASAFLQDLKNRIETFNTEI